MRIPNPELKENILNKVIPMFARSGYNGVSMRDIAAETGLTPAAIYHHFPDKESLYLNALKVAFDKRVGRLIQELNKKGSLEDRLGKMISGLCITMADDPDFHALMQRELLENDTERIQMLAEEVFQDFFKAFRSFTTELAPGYDSHLLALSIIGLVVYHYEVLAIKPFLPGYREETDNIEMIAGHITSLLSKGLFS